MTKAKFLTVFLSAFGLIILMSCGQDVCVAGIGNCSAYKNSLDKQKDLQTGGTGTAPTDKLAIGCKSWGQCWTMSGRNLDLMASGGKPPYTFTAVTAPATVITGSVFNVTASVKTVVRIRVTDANGTGVAPIGGVNTCELCEADVVVLPNPVANPVVKP